MAEEKDTAAPAKRTTGKTGRRKKPEAEHAARAAPQDKDTGSKAQEILEQARTEPKPEWEVAEQVVLLPLDRLRPFKNHPFKVNDEDELMQDTIDSIMAGGVINPILVRPAEDGKFEVVSGHRRFRASELAGKADIKAIVREMDDDTAVIKDVSLRMKNKELDLLIVVNMFLTGFDATTLNTLWVDKNLKMHGLLQAFSRTNRILNSIKTFGNIVCFRNLQKRTDAAIARFSDATTNGVVTLRPFSDYYNGYTDEKGKYNEGYVDLIATLQQVFPLTDVRIVGEARQKAFIRLFGAILRMRNLLVAFDDFKGMEILSERDMQDYMGRYQDLYDEWRGRSEHEKEDITDDVVFEIELIKQIEINIDYILMLMQNYRDSHGKNKEIAIAIQKAVESSSELRSKKALIQGFLAGINDVDDVVNAWHDFVAVEKETQLAALIAEERLKDAETMQFMANAFRDGAIKTTGTEIDGLLPPMSRFGGGNRAEKKRVVTEKLVAFFDRFFGLG